MKNLEDKTKTETLDTLRSYCSFDKEDRVYLLTIMARNKENSNLDTNSFPIFTEIVKSKKDIKRKYNKLKAISDSYIADEGGNLNFRLYLTANARSITDAFLMFKKDLVDLEKGLLNNNEIKPITRLDRKWKSTLQKSGCKDDNYFLIDIDTECKETYKEVFNNISGITSIEISIKTPNGYHIVTEPFRLDKNNNFKKEEVEIEVKFDDLVYIEMI